MLLERDTLSAYVIHRVSRCIAVFVKAIIIRHMWHTAIIEGAKTIMSQQRELTVDMMQQHDMAADSIRAFVPSGRSYRIAKIISQVLHPTVSITLSFLLIGLLGVSNILAGIGWAALIILLQVGPVFTFYSIRLRQGVYSDEEVSVRHQRNELYIFSIVTTLFGITILTLIDAPVGFLALLVSGILLGIFSGLINLTWKISAHAASAALCATTAAIYSPLLGLLLWVGSLAVGWSRIRTRNHTPLQVVAGLSLSTVLVLVTFTAFGVL
jgi:membrane-associated phospholipid phosphatase